MAMIAAFGIGGTNFHYAAGTPDGELLTEIKTEKTRSRELAKQMCTAIDDLNATTSDHVTGVAAACKGLVDSTNGVVELLAINGGDTIRDLSLREAVRAEFGIPLYLENDCTAAALAEYHLGDVEADSLVHVTFGTGIGAGAIDRGRILRGEHNFAGEVGGIPVGPEDGLQWCEIPGAWEAYCSGPGILHFTQEQLQAEERSTRLLDEGIGQLSTPDIFEYAKSGDEVALDYLDTIARYNAKALGTISNLFNPGLISLGGGVTKHNEELVIDGIQRHIDDYLVVDKPTIAATKLENIGIKGALAQAQHHDLLESPTGVSQIQ